MTRRRIELIAIITDFGIQDWYTASLKGVIKRIAPQCDTVDITHQIKPGDIASAAFVLAQCYDDFPEGAVFLCVVDPGVGSTRAPIILDTGEYRFVAPGNGLLDNLADDDSRLFEIDPERLPNRGKTSHTFHGRDIFAPAAAMLAAGVPLEDFCEPKSIGLLRKTPSNPRSEDLGEARIVHVDRYGNLITDFKPSSRRTGKQLRSVSFKGRRIAIAKTYSSVGRNEPLAYTGSTGFLEIAISQGSAEKEFEARIGDSLQLEFETAS